MFQRCIKREENKLTYPRDEYRIDSSGQEWILKDTTIKLKGFDTGLIGGKSWFKVSDRDEKGMFWITSLFGAFGIHKLITGNIASFIIYLLTCGGFGMLTLLDVAAFLTGSAGYDEVSYHEDEAGNLTKCKRRVYYRRLKDKWIIPLGVVCAALVIIVSIKLIYKPLMVVMSQGAVNAAANMDQNSVSDNMKILDQIFDYDLGL